MDPKEPLDPKEMRKKLARALLDEMIFTRPDGPALYKVIGGLLASAPRGIVRVTISVDEVADSDLDAFDLREIKRSREKDSSLSVLLTRLRSDGVDHIIKANNDQPHDYILVTPSSDTSVDPPVAASGARVL